MRDMVQRERVWGKAPLSNICALDVYADQRNRIRLKSASRPDIGLLAKLDPNVRGLAR
jgi:hypothetical protein